MTSFYFDCTTCAKSLRIKECLEDETKEFLQAHVGGARHFVRVVPEGMTTTEEFRGLPEVWEGDLRFGSDPTMLALTANVLLDGVSLKACIAADSKAGVALVYKLDDVGRPLVKREPPTHPYLHEPRPGLGAKTYKLLELKRGKVEIVPRKELTRTGLTTPPILSRRPVHQASNQS